MGLFDIFRRSEEPVQPPMTDVLLRALINSEPITREKALTLPTVSGAVDFITNSVAAMPVRLYRKTDGRVEEVEDDPRVRMLNGDTGDTLDAFQLKKALTEDYLLGKGGYCYIRRRRNEVLGLYYVADIYVTILKNFRPIYKDYVVCVEGKNYEPHQFLKILRNTKDGASGIGLTEEVSKALETAYNTLLYQLGIVKTGGNKRGFIKSQKRLTEEAMEKLRAGWAKMYANNEANVVVLNEGLDFQEASNSSVEMQLNESKRTFAEEINALFHIHPENFDLTFKEAIYPIVKAFETALNRDLLLEREKGEYFFVFDVKEIIRASLKERYEAYKMAKETGFMTLNEIRRQENMDYIEGLDVVNVGLGAVLYDANTHKFYTPNTDTSASFDQQNIEKVIEDKEIDQAFEEGGNSSEG